MKHLLIIDQSDFISTPIGGSTTFLRTIVPHLTGYFEVSLLGRTGQAELIGKWSSNYLGTARFFGIGNISKSSKFIPGRLQTLYQIWQTRSLIKDLNPDILYFHQTETAIPFINFTLYSKVLHIHGLSNPLSVSRFPFLRNKIFQMFYNTVFRRVERSVDMILSVSKPDPSDLNELPLTHSCPLHYIPVCIDSSMFVPSDKSDARRKLNLPQSTDIIGYVGRLSSKKNIESTLHALRYLTDQGENILFLIIGDGEHLDSLKHLCIELRLTSNVTFIPAQSYQDLSTYYNAMDSLVMTSLAEGFPMVVLESLASGTPVMSSRVGAIPDVIINGLNGYIFPSLECDSVAATISAALLQKKELALSTRKSAEPFFAEQIARQIAQAIGT